MNDKENPDVDVKEMIAQGYTSGSEKLGDNRLQAIMTKSEVGAKASRIIENISEHRDFFEVYQDGKSTNPKEFVDDGFVHIVSGKFRFSFYRGQDKNEFNKGDIPKFRNFVDKIVQEVV